MSTSVLERPADTKQEVYTKEELQTLRRKLAGESSTGGTKQGLPLAEQNPEPPDWESDVDLIIKFLVDIDKIMKFLVDNRIPEPIRKLFQKAMKDTDADLAAAIEKLKDIKSDTHPLYLGLKKVGLALEALLAKLDGFRDGITGGSVLAVLDSGDKILGSLCKVLDLLERVKEMKEAIEYRVKYGADAGLISLNLYPR